MYNNYYTQNTATIYMEFDRIENLELHTLYTHTHTRAFKHTCTVLFIRKFSNNTGN